MTLAAAARLVILWLGWLVSADAIAGLILGHLSPARRLLELALGVLLLSVSTRVVHPRRLFAGVLGWSALAGLLRIAYVAGNALLYHRPHAFTAFGYAWRAALFVGLGVGFLQMTREKIGDETRAV